MTTETLIAACEFCLGWPYVSPGTNDQRGIDCSGLLVRAFRRQGLTIAHGSNTIWRKHLTRKGRIQKAADLQPGMAVFKWKSQDTAKYPDGQGDFCHIGVVTGVQPLRIVHASSVKGCVTTDTRLGKWSHWGWLKGVAEAETLPADADAPLPILRRGDRGAAVEKLQALLVAAGYEIGMTGVDGLFGRRTERAVRQFQHSHHLAADGVVGALTWAALQEGGQTYG